MTTRCLSCCDVLDDTAVGSYHRRCARRLFGVAWQPQIPFRRDDAVREAAKMIGKMSISGVQPKLSATLDKKRHELVVSPTGGDYIVKPPNELFPEFPQNEHLCMTIVDVVGMHAPPHGLLPLADGALSYVIKRFDRTAQGKVHVEDLSQLMGLPPEAKYDTSMEKMGKAIAAFSENPLLDLIEVFERTVLSVLIGNGDMHLKNWSLIESTSGGIHIAPCYDFCSSALVLPQGDEVALPINGKLNRIMRKDLLHLAKRYGIESRTVDHALAKLPTWRNICLECAEKCFLSDDFKAAFKGIVTARFKSLA